jgi:ankyrin repeat protein
MQVLTLGPLIKKGIQSLNFLKIPRWPPIMFAACNGNFDCCEFLIECGETANCTTAEGRTPLHLVAQIGILFN